MNEFVEWGALANIVIIGVLVGAGLPMLFAAGVRAMHGPGSRDAQGNIRPMRRAVAALCLAVVLSAILFAIVYLALGSHG